MKWYTYTHATPDGSVFYIGKGCGHRAFSTGKRPVAWREAVARHGGITIKIVARFASEDEAFSHERALIDLHRGQGAKLINETSGGAGPTGYWQSAETRARKSAKMRGYKFKTVTCPNCGFSGGETATKRWHFEKCTGLKLHRARTTVNGKRVFLGNYATKAEAEMAVSRFKAEAA